MLLLEAVAQAQRRYRGSLQRKYCVMSRLALLHCVEADFKPASTDPAGERFHADARSRVRVGDTVHGEIEITGVRPTSQGNRGIVVSRIEVKNQQEEIVMTYEATRLLAGRAFEDTTVERA